MINTTASNLDRALLPVLNGFQYRLPSFQRMYGRLPVEAIKGVDNLKTGDKDRPRRLPLWWDAVKQSNVPIVPDEKLGDLLFVTTTSTIKPIDWQPGQVSLGSIYYTEYPLAIYAWWDKSKDNGLRSEQVLNRLLQELGGCYDWVTTGIEDQLATRVFRDLDYDFDNHRYLLTPYGGLRIEGTFTVTESICSNS